MRVITVLSALNITSSPFKDAGFDIDFTSIYWTYATGFPKDSNIRKAIDKKHGKEREVVGKDKHFVKPVIV